MTETPVAWQRFDPTDKATWPRAGTYVVSQDSGIIRNAEWHDDDCWWTFCRNTVIANVIAYGPPLQKYVPPAPKVCCRCGHTLSTTEEQYGHCVLSSTMDDCARNVAADRDALAAWKRAVEPVLNRAMEVRQTNNIDTWRKLCDAIDAAASSLKGQDR